MRCDQCKHWESSDGKDWTANEAGFRRCLAVRERWTIQDEASQGLSYGGGGGSNYASTRKNALIAARAYVQDGSEYFAELLTAPDFFCALFQIR